MSTSLPLQTVRWLRLGLHLLWGSATIALVYPCVRTSTRLWLKQRWSHQLLKVLGVRLDAHLSGIASGSLIVANHVSWLDIYAINAARPVAFVSKSEVQSWPLIGWLATHTDTLFICRENRRDINQINSAISQKLNEKKDVAIFPEGTTTDGTHVLEFRGALLQPAIIAGRTLQPVSLAYCDAAGKRTTTPAYTGTTTMAESLAAIIASPALTVCLRATPPLDPQGRSQRELALAAQGAIAQALGLPAIACNSSRLDRSATNAVSTKE